MPCLVHLTERGEQQDLARPSSLMQQRAGRQERPASAAQLPGTFHSQREVQSLPCRCWGCLGSRKGLLHLTCAQRSLKCSKR